MAALWLLFLVITVCLNQIEACCVDQSIYDYLFYLQFMYTV